ncbi:hypothetical protein ACLB2K_056092 [Fragaria x ananassa]
MAQLLEFQSLKHGRSHAKSRREKAKWCSPPSGRLKLNIDGAYKEDGSGGVGMIIRDAVGDVKCAWSKKLGFLSSPLHAEADACRLGLRMATQHGWQNLEVESDCAILVPALNNQGSDMVEVSRILEDCRDFIRRFDYVTVQHVFREANSVAHRLAHFATCDRVVEVTLAEVPDFIQDVLYENNCNALNMTRGRRYMSPSMAQNSININNGQGAEPS